jgi:hypothetical protein
LNFRSGKYLRVAAKTDTIILDAKPNVRQLVNIKTLKFLDVVYGGLEVHELFEFLSVANAQLTQLNFYIVTATTNPVSY